MYVLAISLRDVCSREARRHEEAAPPADAGLVPGERGLADARGLRCRRGADQAKDGASAHRDTRAHQHGDLYRDGDGDSYRDTQTQTYLNDAAAPAAASAGEDPNARAAHRDARCGRYRDGHDHC